MSKTLLQKIAASRWLGNTTSVRHNPPAMRPGRMEPRRRVKMAVTGRESAGNAGLVQHLEPTDRCFGIEPARQHPYGAWTVRFGGHTRWIDLNTFGVDANAVEQVPPEVAMAFNLIPLRCMGTKLLAAVPRNSELPAEEVGMLVGKELHLVWADAKEIRAAIEWHYGVRCAAA